jgi:predicted dehydrogenase
MGTTSRRGFFKRSAAGAGLAAGFGRLAKAEDGEAIQGFDDTETTVQEDAVWEPVSDRRIKVGIAGFGVCQFGAAFGFQNHPNVEVVAVTDLFPDRCEGLAKACRCDTKYASCEEMIEDDGIEAVFIATDARSHARLAVEALKRGKHVASAVPACFGSLEEAEELYEAVLETGMKYMLFETSAYHSGVYAARKVYNDGRFGTMVYSEGEYYHYMAEPIPSYNDWRVGLPPQYYPTHSNAYYTAITGGSFTEVSCMGLPSVVDHLKPENNVYGNPFGTEVALLRTSEGGMARMAVSWDTPGHGGEKGRVRGEKGSAEDMDIQVFHGVDDLDLAKPPLPPSVDPGGHGGSHGYLMNEFVEAILEDRTPLVDIAWGLNMTVAGIVSHQSAMKDGELLKIPQYSWPA